MHDSNAWMDPFGLSECSVKIKETQKASLPEEMVKSFEGGIYKTGILEEDLIVYRAFGGNAKLGGSYVTTSAAGNRINAKIEAALLPSWKNTREFEAIIKVPKGTTISYGKVAPQTIDKTGSILKGGADQILLPRDWPEEWVQQIVKLSSK